MYVNIWIKYVINKDLARKIKFSLCQCVTNAIWQAINEMNRICKS